MLEEYREVYQTAAQSIPNYKDLSQIELAEGYAAGGSMSEAMNIEQLLEIIDHSEAAVLHEYVTDVNAVDVARCAQQLDDRQLWKLCYLLQSEWFSPLQMMN